MNSNLGKALSIAAFFFGAVILAYLAYSRPGYFTSKTDLAGLLLLECLAAAIWLYRRVFFIIVVVTFLLAGMDLPVGSVWTAARWLVLGVGALVGLTIILKERRYSFGMFHVLAFFAILAALVSAAVSRYVTISLLKVLSLFLLYVYAATGVRLAVFNRENRFFEGLLIGCEIFVAFIGGLYLLGIEAMGNPNSLGAVMGVVGAPILLWGSFIHQERFTARRRMILFLVATYLTFSSHARAGMLALLLSCALLCLALRRYVVLASGITVLAILIASAAIFQPDAFSNTVSSFTSSVVYKQKDPAEGLLGSRTSPWQDSIDAIREHLWFGTGFGTSDTVEEATENIGRFASSSATATEHGSSYLALLAWVGVAGALPFVLLLAAIVANIVKVVMWMFRTGDPLHPAVPLAIVMCAGLIHATFEDWLFAPGYYLCLFYWAMAFVFVDQTKLLRMPTSIPFWWKRPLPAQGSLGVVSSTR
ncbi:MAG TPA: O-antigen ligase family protein [Candidatus Acidoferrales bacterium]|nr:O-antigen ligase family protein [Candidatus Acidoferrales bacterium]